MTHTDLCKARPFEWRNGELFAVSDSVCKDTAWIDSYTIQQARTADKGITKEIIEGEFPFYVIQRLESGDRVFEVDDYVVFAGGDILCFIKPVTGVH